MKDTIAKIILVLMDLLAIAVSITLAFYARNAIDIFESVHTIELSHYISFYPLYLVTVAVLAYEGVYNQRYDFWHETRLVFKAMVFSLLIVLAYLAMTKSVENFSRAVIVLSFVFMTFFIPFFKRVAKKLLYRGGLWQKSAKIYGSDASLHEEIYRNFYLGYVPEKTKEAKTVFISTSGMNLQTLQHTINEQLSKRHEVLFIPLLNDFDLTHSQIYELANIRTNLISLKNRLKSRFRRIFKYLFDLVTSLLLLPLLLPILGIIAYLIKKEEPGGSILFRQERLGKDGVPFVCYKFRTMVENGDEVLRKYLEKHPEEAEYYDKYHKYINDPRVTRIGAFLRKTSLDELPQIFNVIKGEMSLVGPRPYMLNEKEKMGEAADTILSVRPGITGLWQVSGRSEVDFFERLDMDVWYIRNWNLWLDITVLIKTVKTVLVKEGAY